MAYQRTTGRRAKAPLLKSSLLHSFAKFFPLINGFPEPADGFLVLLGKEDIQ
jgi:hypothetical protein